MKARRGAWWLSAAAALALLVPAGAAAAPSHYRHDLRRLDAHLRVALEFAPEQLGEGLGTSENVCRLAAKAEAKGEVDLAADDWSTLSQLVSELDEPAARRIDGALARADSLLRQMRKRYSRAWSDPARIGQLRAGVVRSREGIQLVQAAVAKISTSFGLWRGHQCSQATAAIEAGIARIPGAINHLNAGMRPLWELAERPR